MDAPQPVSYDMSHYFTMMRRHWWIIALLTAVGVVGGVAVARTQPKVYESSTSVLVMPTSASSTTVTGARTSGAINLDTEAQLVTSAAVAADAAKLLKTTTPADSLTTNVTINVPANTSVMAITYAAGTPLAAQAGSHAFAAAYLANRQSSAQADLTGQITAINTTITRQQVVLTRINNELATLPPASAKYANVESQRQTLTSQINTLTNRMNDLTTTTVTSGQIITDANLPLTPSKPSIPLYLSSGAMLGILIGIALALLRQRSDKLVRVASDVPRRSGLPLLAQLPARVKPRFDDVFPPYGTGGRTFNRLRNEVLASLSDKDQVIVVTGASKGNSSTLVSANLASALARAGSEVVLICAHLPETMAEAAPITRLLGVAATPGLSDVLAGKVPLDTATQRAPRNPWLRVITTGGTASATGFLQSQTLRDILTQLRTQAEYIVIEAPSTANSADAQSLASFADAAIVVVEMKRTTHNEVIDAADQLRRVTTSMVGCVVLPRLKRTMEVPSAPPLGRPLNTAPTDGPYVESLPTAPIRVSRDLPDLDRRRVDTSAETQLTAGALGLRTADSSREPSRDSTYSLRDPMHDSVHDSSRDSVHDSSRDSMRDPVHEPSRDSLHESVRPIVTAAEAAAATSAAESGMADSFFAGESEDGDLPAGSRRRILPGRRGILRNQPPRRPSPARPGGAYPDPTADATVMFDSPMRADAVAHDPQRVDASNGNGQVDTRNRVVPNISLPEKAHNQTPVNPTNIVSPVLGATEIVVKPSGGASEPKTVKPRESEPAAELKASGSKSVGPKSVGSKSVPGTKPQEAPLAGGSGETVTFKRIDLVYVEDGDGDGSAR
jgi:Mrp family chromosome partitioning ATPase